MSALPLRGCGRDARVPGPAPLLLLVPVLLLLAMACSGSEQQSTGPDRVVFMAGFRPQANLPFVAAYVAQEKGYFREQGLDVEILHASSGEHLKLMLAGDVDFTTASASSVLKRRADDLPVVAIALFGQRSQQAFVALGDSGIETPADWEGSTFGYKISQPPEYLAILKVTGVDRSRVHEVRVGFDPRVLTDGEVDVLAVFNSNEPDTIRRLGFDVNVWHGSDFGVPGMGLTYVTRQDMVDERPDVAERFLKATLKGLADAMADVDGTLNIVLKYAPEEDREHQRFMLETEIGDAVSPLTDAHGPGWMTAQQWRGLYEQLLEFEALPRPFDHNSAFTDRFLRAIYSGGRLTWP